MNGEQASGPRAVVPDDHPGSDGKWRRSVESRLERLFTAAATSLRRKVDDGDFVIEGGGDIKILDDNGMIVWSALDGPARTAGGQYDSPDLNLPGDFTDTTGFIRIDVPDGYTTAEVLLYAAAGTSFDTPGNYLVGVQPMIQYDDQLEGPPISTGGYLPSGQGTVLAACSAVSQQRARLTGLRSGGPDDWIALWCLVYASGSANKKNNSGNYHLSAQVTFTR